MTITTVKKELRKMDPKLDLKSDAGLAAQFLLAATQVGTVTKNISTYMKVPAEDIQAFAIQARRNKIFKSGKVHASWFDENGAIGFWMDVNVVLGLMKRT